MGWDWLGPRRRVTLLCAVKRSENLWGHNPARDRRDEGASMTYRRASGEISDADLVLPHLIRLDQHVSDH